MYQDVTVTQPDNSYCASSSLDARLMAAGRTLLLALAVWLAPAAAQAQNDRPTADLAGVVGFAGRRITAIDITGQRVTKPFVIRREIHTTVGTPLDVALVQQDVTRLENLGIFAEVRTSGEAAGDDGVRLVFTFRETPPWFPVLTYAYTEENGGSIGVGVSSINLTGRALSVSARTYFGEVTQQWAQVSWPWITGDHVSFNLYAANLARRDVLRSFGEKSQELTPEIGTAVGMFGRVRAKFSAFRMQSDTAGITLSPSGQDQLFRLGASYVLDSRDSWTNPRNGWENEVEVWRTGGFLGGDGDWWSTNLDVRRWLPVSSGTKLMLSGLVSLQSGTLGKDVPVYMNYNLGGANSIRGYGATDLGTAFSGKNQMLGTAEYSFTIVPPRRFDLWKISLRLGAEIATFADAGIAWSESRDLTLPRVRTGFGSGLRILIPGTEMVRLDFGWSPDYGVHFHFASGSKPKAQRERRR